MVSLIIVAPSLYFDCCNYHAFTCNKFQLEKQEQFIAWFQIAVANEVTVVASVIVGRHCGCCDAYAAVAVWICFMFAPNIIHHDSFLAPSSTSSSLLTHYHFTILSKKEKEWKTNRVRTIKHVAAWCSPMWPFRLLCCSSCCFVFSRDLQK